MGAKIVIYGPNAAMLDTFRQIAPPGTDLGWVDSNLSVDDQAEQMKDAVAAIVAGGNISVELATRCTNLRLVQTTSAGTNRLDKAGLGELIRKAFRNKKKRTKLGPITVRVKVDETPGAKRLNRSDFTEDQITWTE